MMTWTSTEIRDKFYFIRAHMQGETLLQSRQLLVTFHLLQFTMHETGTNYRPGVAAGSPRCHYTWPRMQGANARVSFAKRTSP